MPSFKFCNDCLAKAHAYDCTQKPVVDYCDCQCHFDWSKLTGGGGAGIPNELIMMSETKITINKGGTKAMTPEDSLDWGEKRRQEEKDAAAYRQILRLPLNWSIGPGDLFGSYSYDPSLPWCVFKPSDYGHCEMERVAQGATPEEALKAAGIKE